MKIDTTKVTNIIEIIGIKKLIEAVKIAKTKLTKKLMPSLTDTTNTAPLNASINRKKLKKLLAVDYPSFSAVLSYRYYWEEKNLFINEHSIGFGLELTVFSGADEKLVNSFSDLLRHRIDDEVDLQFILWGSNQVGDIIDKAYEHQLGGNNIYSELAKASIQYYKKAARKGFRNRLNLPTTLREYRLFVFLSKNTPYTDKAVAAIELARDNFIVELESIGVSFIELTLNNFLPLLRSWINPDLKNIYHSSQKHEEHTTLNEQVVDKSFELINEFERLVIEVDSEKHQEDENTENGNSRKERIRTKLTSLSIRNLPDEFALWESPDNFFNVFRSSQAIIAIS
ncbi:hypothetical protein GAMM_30028 [Gammaproteobacteria bacterium]